MDVGTAGSNPHLTVHHNFFKKIRGGKSIPPKNIKNKILIFSRL